MTSLASTPTTWLVTGASRGIGLEFVRQLLASPGNLVIAACRNPSGAGGLAALRDSADTKGTLRTLTLDVDDFDGVRAAGAAVAEILGDSGLDYLVNNAGIMETDTAFTLDPERLLQVVRTNAAGPALVSQVCLPFLEKGRRKTILYVSSTAGSIGSVERIGARVASYAISKAALNMLAVKQKTEKPELIVITTCPGWVKTDMGGTEAPLEADGSVADILEIVTSAKPEDSGKFLRYNGDSIPW